MLESRSQEAYDGWLSERGLLELKTSAAYAAGVLFSAGFHESPKTLLVASSTLSRSREVAEMLNKLAVAIGEPTAVVLLDGVVSSVRGLLALTGLERVIFLGNSWPEVVSRWGNFGSLEYVYGPSAEALVDQIDVKRQFWNLLKSQILVK